VVAVLAFGAFVSGSHTLRPGTDEHYHLDCPHCSTRLAIVIGDPAFVYRSRPGATIASIADDLGINRETLRSWVRLDDERRGAAGPRQTRPGAAAGEAAGSVEQENAELRRRVRALEEERDILRKAARYFAGETRW
jgi:transposase